MSDTEAAEKAELDAKSITAKNTLNQIKSATTKDMMPNSSDIAAAMAAARAAGNPGLATELAAMAFEAEQGFKKDDQNADIFQQKTQDETPNLGAIALSRADNYFADEDVAKSEDTSNRLSQGEDTSLEDLQHLVDGLCSDKDREEREALEEELDEAELNEYKEAFFKGTTPGETLDKIAERQAQLTKRAANAEAVTAIVGSGHSKESLKEATVENETKLKSSLQNTAGRDSKLKENKASNKERLDERFTAAIANFDPNNLEASVASFAEFEKGFKAEKKKSKQEVKEATNTHNKEARARSQEAALTTPEKEEGLASAPKDKQQPEKQAAKKAEKEAGGVVNKLGNFIKKCRKHEADVKKDPGRSKNDVPNLKPKQRETDGPPRAESGGRSR